jgi:hypothetical protein
MGAKACIRLWRCEYDSIDTGDTKYITKVCTLAPLAVPPTRQPIIAPRACYSLRYAKGTYARGGPCEGEGTLVLKNKNFKDMIFLSLQ